MRMNRRDFRQYIEILFAPHGYIAKESDRRSARRVAKIQNGLRNVFQRKKAVIPLPKPLVQAGMHIPMFTNHHNLA
jgi:hypothetical protein